MVDPIIELCGKYPSEHLFIWTQLSYTQFFHLDGWFASLWEFTIDTVWPYCQLRKRQNGQICQKFHRTPWYFWCGYLQLRNQHARYEFSSPSKWENPDSWICNCFFECFKIWTIRQGTLWCTTGPVDTSRARRSGTKLHACSEEKVSFR